jgi:uncharacterized membrane protein YagU involved in acid resistance
MTGTHLDTSRWVKQGMLGGVIAGLVFAMFEMVMAALMNGAEAFFMPLRMIGAMVLGGQALDPGYPLATAALVGAGVHMVMSGAFGMVFGLIASAMPTLTRSTGALVVAAGVFGLLLWLVDFYVVAPAAGWDWFPNGTNETVQFLAHAVFFGAVLGLYLARVRSVARGA